MNRAARPSRPRCFRQALLVITAAAVIALVVLGRPQPTHRRTRFRFGPPRAGGVPLFWLGPAAADTPPYTLPVSLPGSVNAPSVDASAPYTPAVLSLIAQLEPTATPTLAQVQNLGTLLHDGPSPDCHNVGPVGRPFGLDASGNVAGTTLAAAAAAGATNIKVASVTPFSVGQTIWVDATSDAEQVTIAAVGTVGSGGTGLDFAAPLARAHANGRPAYVTLTTPS